MRKRNNKSFIKYLRIVIPGLWIVWGVISIIDDYGVLTPAEKSVDDFRKKTAFMKRS